ncbi:heterokaryon incompatibility protein-domain-containing protein [Xylaria arbuscula]|nr:heterokaryon incompatibility protein-domain-containing protein [Xylaria arbuscula]
MESLESIFSYDLENASHSESFTYGTSPLGPNEIRILILLPEAYAGSSTDVHCQLLRLDLDATKRCGLDRHPFVALSYCWGPIEPKKTIFLNGKEKIVTPNLYDALIHIRDILSPVSLWVDAICINQGDLEERQCEVQKMGNIYRDATAVLLWLGIAEGHDPFKKEFGSVAETLSKVAESQKELQTHSLLEKENENAWTVMIYGSGGKRSREGDAMKIALWALFSLPVWRRVWIMQELILAKETYLLWGRTLIDFQILDQLLKVQSEFIPNHPYFDDTQASMRRYTMARQVIMLRSQKPTLLTALLAVRYRLTTVEHDYVYGLMGFADLGESLILPRYEKPVRDVYLESFEIILRQELNLDVLSACDRGWAACSRIRESDLDWPTWLPDWSWRPTRLLSEGGESKIAYSFEIESLLLDTSHRTAIDYKACGESKRVVQILPTRKHLRVRGIEFDQVEKIIQEFPQGELSIGDMYRRSELWVEIVKSMWEQGRLSNVYDTIYTLKYACERTARYGHEIAIRIAAPKMQAFSMVEEKPASCASTENSSSSVFEPFDSSEKYRKCDEDKRESDPTLAWAGLSKSSYCITKRGYIARTPVSTMVGDKVCVFFGGKVPMLLRQQDGSEYFQLAGEIYVHGIMQGAGIEAMKDQWKDFVIC